MTNHQFIRLFDVCVRLLSHNLLWTHKSFVIKALDLTKLFVTSYVWNTWVQTLILPQISHATSGKTIYLPKN